MKRKEHLDWCKGLAREYLKAGNHKDAIAVFMIEMSKHNETSDHRALDILMMMYITGQLNDVTTTSKMIEGFN